MSAKETILTRIRTALADVEEREPLKDVPSTWTYGAALGTEDILADLVEKVEDYKARVLRVRPDEVARAIADELRHLGTRSCVVPDGLDPAWVEAIEGTDATVHRDDPPLDHATLNGIDTVVTGAAVAMADSGTIALDHGPDQGRRALTLLPDRHVCVVRAEQVVSDVPEGIARLREAVDARRPITWLSGGSATSDIELSRVEGVHGPRTLEVVLLSGPRQLTMILVD